MSETRMQELVDQLNEASRAYYQESRELMSNLEYDALYDELEALEKESGLVLAKSPTHRAGYEVVSELPKEAHASPMLSLDKTKEVPALQDFLGDQIGMLSWKLDGITIVVTYQNGTMQKAVTRGNGLIGEVVTANAKQFINLPARIPFQGTLVLRGEAVISYPDFEKMNAELDEEARYKNPRNLTAGSVRQLNSEITAQRNVRLEAFALISAEENGISPDFHNSRMAQMEWLKAQGFSTVEYKKATRENLPECVHWFSEAIQTFSLPSDGLVLLMDDIAYGDGLGRTAKFPRNAMAFKWKDELAETTFRSIEWSPSRTGLINPVAVFDPVELEGTTVGRASVHNLSILEALELGEGDTISVYKANMIIPQIAQNLTRSNTLQIPSVCPVCGMKTQIQQNADVKCLCCGNPECPAKQIKAYQLFVSRDALNIDGLSEATMERLIDRGFIHEFADVFRLERYQEEIISMDHFGKKSYDNLIASIEKAKTTTLPQLIYALGIPGIGVANAKMLTKAFSGDFSAIRAAKPEELMEIEGIGSVLAEGISSYFQKEEVKEHIDHLLEMLTIQAEEPVAGQVLEGMVFVITGSLNQFENRNGLKAWIEDRGGKVTGSVSAKTTFLINNDTASNSSKNKKAKELGIEILSEEDLLQRFGA